MKLKPDDWVQGLDLQNLVRYGTVGQMRGLIATAIREAINLALEEAAEFVETQGTLLHSMFDGRHDALISDLAAGIRRRKE